ncbi:D-glucuronyl C5-epimerase-like protein, partial [Euroglyphus maynei]
CQDQICEKAGQFYDEGIRSLESSLSLYDSGSGSFYDLRHLSLGIAPNIARWDYHSTHINQLLYLYTIARNDLFKTVSDRWIAYMKGHRASHN